MKVSNNGLLFLAKEEGCVLHPYLDKAGIPTIGIGNTFYEDGSKVTMKDEHITQKRAVALFKIVLARFEIDVAATTGNKLNQNQFDATVSLVYNIGVNGFKISTVRSKILADQTDPTIKDAWLLWDKIRNKKTNKLEKSDELYERREREVKLYFTSVS